METIGDSSENPFENCINDVPMTAICRKIEIDLREKLGETELSSRVCLKNIAGDENSRFWVLTERPFSGNNGAYCPKKTRKTGFKRCIFGPVNVFQTHSKVQAVNGVLF